MTTASGLYWFWLKSYCWTFPFACKRETFSILRVLQCRNDIVLRDTGSFFFFFLFRLCVFCYLRVQPESTKREPCQGVIWEKGSWCKKVPTSVKVAGALMDSFGNRHSVKSNLLERDRERWGLINYLHTLDWHSSKAKVVSLDIKLALRGSASFIIKGSSPISADLFSSLQDNSWEL